MPKISRIIEGKGYQRMKKVYYVFQWGLDGSFDVGSTDQKMPWLQKMPWMDEINTYQSFWDAWAVKCMLESKRRESKSAKNI